MRFDNSNGNGNREMQTTQQQNADRDREQSLSITNNVETSFIKSIANTPFPPSATGTPAHQQLQPERDPTMAMLAMVTYCCSGMRTGNHNLKMGHGLGASSARDKTMPYAEDNTIITAAAAAVGNSTPRNTVYIFLLHYNCGITNRLAS